MAIRDFEDAGDRARALTQLHAALGGVLTALAREGILPDRISVSGWTLEWDELPTVHLTFRHDWLTPQQRTWVKRTFGHQAEFGSFKLRQVGEAPYVVLKGEAKLDIVGHRTPGQIDQHDERAEAIVNVEITGAFKCEAIGQVLDLEEEERDQRSLAFQVGKMLAVFRPPPKRTVWSCKPAA